MSRSPRPQPTSSTAFVSAKLQAREEAVARAKFAEATAGEHERREGQAEKAENLNCISQADMPARSPYQNETNDYSREAEDEHRVNGWGSVETIIRRLSAHISATCWWTSRGNFRLHHRQNISDSS